MPDREENTLLGRLTDEVRGSRDSINKLTVIIARLEERSKFQEIHNSTSISDLHAIKTELSQALKLMNQIPELKVGIKDVREDLEKLKEGDIKKLNTFKDKLAPIYAIVITVITALVAKYFGVESA